VSAQKIRIVLISPKGPLYKHKTGIFRKSLRVAPLTLTTLAALIPEELDSDIRLIDEGVEDIPTDLEADLVGMTVITGSAPRSYELSRQFRDRGIPVVLGGPHVTLVPDEAAAHADCIVTGYAEETWPQLLRDFSRREMKKRYSMSPDFSLATPGNHVFPKRHLLPKTMYRTQNTFEATRGCIHSCEFCVVPSAWGRKPFHKPIGQVVEDIRRTGAKHLVFYDLNLIADPAYAKELFSALIPLRIQWFGLSTTFLNRDRELLELTAKSGCMGLLVGFESVNRASLAAVKKGFNKPDEYPAFIRELHGLGIALMGTFVFGSDGDTPQSFAEVVDFVHENRIDLPRFSVMTPFPGTPLHARLDAAGRILTKDWSLYDGQHVVFRPSQMTPKQLLDGHEWAWKKTYSYRHMASRMMRIMPHWPLILTANFGYRFYAHHLGRFYTCQGGLA
jgi:radical SAM superfamily enzyme YgiQ (UPF0313 family)